MLVKLRSYLTYSNVMATGAVFVALGGTSYAVATGSIDSREIKNNTVRSKDVRNRSLLATDFKAGQLPAGPQGDTGATGPPGETEATGQPGTSVFASTIPSGTTMRGVFGDVDIGTDTDNSARVAGAVSFAVPAPASLSDNQVNFAPSGSVTPGDTDAACSGSLDAHTAPPGKVCLYVNDLSGQAGSALGLSLSATGDSGKGRFGFAFIVTGNTADPSRAQVRGTWAYTAP